MLNFLQDQNAPAFVGPADALMDHRTLLGITDLMMRNIQVQVDRVYWDCGKVPTLDKFLTCYEGALHEHCGT